MTDTHEYLLEGRHRVPRDGLSRAADWPRVTKLEKRRQNESPMLPKAMGKTQIPTHLLGWSNGVTAR